MAGARMTGKAFRPKQARLVAEAFAKHGVEYLFIGKGGAMLLGQPGARQDVARFPRRSETHGRRIVAALLELGFSLRPADQGDVVHEKDFVQIGSGPFELDLMFAPDGIESFDAALRNAERVENFPVMALPEIIASKRAAGTKMQPRADGPAGYRNKLATRWQPE